MIPFRFSSREATMPVLSPLPAVQLVKTDLNAFLQKHENHFREILGPTINLRYSFAGNASEIEADHSSLLRLLDIFLSNAKKAMPHGGQLLLQTREVVMPETEGFQSGSSGSFLMLAISDSGNGIPAEMQIKIQQLFSGRWRPQGGFLPSLLEAKDILHRHRARLLLYSQMIRGTSFKIYFPLKKTDAIHPAPAVPTKGTETLLFVEDDAVVRHIYTKFLRQRGYHVLEAEHGKKAFDVYENYAGHIHLMITDVVMPELNGRQLVDLVSLRRPS
jgi:two-component system, cell cycle sensor histidine kinase and response regulator CckA